MSAVDQRGEKIFLPRPPKSPVFDELSRLANESAASRRKRNCWANARVDRVEIKKLAVDYKVTSRTIGNWIREIDGHLKDAVLTSR